MSTLAPPNTALPADSDPGSGQSRFIEVGSRSGTAKTVFSVPGMHCAGCIAKIERKLSGLAGIENARANLTARRVTVIFDRNRQTVESIRQALTDAGFDAAAFDARLMVVADADQDKVLLRAMAVAGFAAANVMLLSVGVWAGLASDMAFETRQLFHWISALIALPAVAYAGRPFFTSARRALVGGRMNMEIPIALAVLLAAGASLIETIRGAEHVYFDAAVTLLFFLLIGRYLDRRMRSRASDAARNLLTLQATAATVIGTDGHRYSLAVDDLKPGMRIFVAPGMRIPADGRVVEGTSDIDMSLLTGESEPITAGTGDKALAGTQNLSGPLTIEIEAARDDTVLAEIARLMETAEQGRARYVRLADRAARVYAPAVHLLAFAAFAGWLIAGAGWHSALMVAIAVLIITCPCALGLAVPVVQVVAAGRLLRQGTLLCSADGLERLAGVDTIVFDKTGTLTLGQPTLVNSANIDSDHLDLAAALAAHSTHPLAKALTNSITPSKQYRLTAVKEVAGRGLQAQWGEAEVRLGRAEWAGAATVGDDRPVSHIWFRQDGEPPIRLDFRDTLRPGAAAAVTTLKQLGYRLLMLSGDRQAVTRAIAQDLRMTDWRAGCRPADKIATIEALKANGATVLMVGDGLNDAPALRAADVSISPATAADISQTAADFIFQRRDLGTVPDIITIAKQSRRLVLENFTLALAYNIVAVPLAVAGLVTPLIAAVAMSSSSLLVTANAMRLSWRRTAS